MKFKNSAIQPHAYFPDEELPFQIIQLPVYNENVSLVMHLVISATRLSYPINRLLIQLLDDSDDQIISARLEAFVSDVNKRKPGFMLFYIHRNQRTGFKAGNLNNGLKKAKTYVERLGDYDADKIIVSIFDADFIIPSNYLKDSVHFFTTPEVGAIQADLSYYNVNTNCLTRAQASFLRNLHHIEFGTRSRAGHVTTCRGSAGSWRLSAIEAAGGWQNDTQIEDVDLSIATQLCGWKILYLDHIFAWCQLPTSYNEFKLQQRSWVKGLMEVFRKRGRSIISSPKLSIGQKILATDFFVILSLQPLFMVVGHLFLIPSYYCLKMYGFPDALGWITLGLFFLLSSTHLSFLSTGLPTGPGKELKPPPDHADLGKHRILNFLLDKCYSIALIPSLFVSLTYGLMEGLLGLKVHRGKTNKVDHSGIVEYPDLSTAQRKILTRISRFETFMSVYSIFLVGWAILEMELIIALIYGVLAICYPWNRILSGTNTHRGNN